MADAPPRFPGAHWQTADPRDLGLNPARLAAAGARLGAPGSNAAAFLVVRHGALVWEQYYQGHTPAERMHLFSVTKSVLSCLVGIALQEGHLRDVDQPLLDFFPQVQPQPANPLGLLRLHHLLSMSTGLLWPARGAHELMMERLRRSPNWVDFILGLSVRRAEIGKFHYCSAASHLLSAVLTRAAGQNACDYAAARLFAPLGIAPVHSGSEWEADPQGITTGGWGLHLTAREIARFGWLVACDGQWDGRIVVDAGWLRRSTRPAGAFSPGYGYQWWLRTLAGQPICAALGMGGQYLVCHPARGLVVVIVSRMINRWPDRWPIIEGLLENG